MLARASTQTSDLVSVVIQQNDKLEVKRSNVNVILRNLNERMWSWNCSRRAAHRVATHIWLI